MTRRPTDAQWHELRAHIWCALRDNFLRYGAPEIDVLSDVVMHALDDYLPKESVNADLLEALRPFAYLAYFYPNDANETLVCGTMKPTVGNLRRALDAISLAEKSNG